jgi:hypothetical protein
MMAVTAMDPSEQDGQDLNIADQYLDAVLLMQAPFAYCDRKVGILDGF